MVITGDVRTRGKVVVIGKFWSALICIVLSQLAGLNVRGELVM